MNERQMDRDIRFRSQRQNNLKKKQTIQMYPVDQVFSLNDDKIWYDIPGFPKYQYCDQGYIRSFKSRKKFPYGVVLGFKHTSNGDMYSLTDRNNFVRSISFMAIKSIVESSKDILHPYHTFEVPNDNISRNIHCFLDERVDQSIPGKVVKKPRKVQRDELNNKEISTLPDFCSALDDMDKALNPNIIHPIHFVEG